MTPKVKLCTYDNSNLISVDHLKVLLIEWSAKSDEIFRLSEEFHISSEIMLVNSAHYLKYYTNLLHQSSEVLLIYLCAALQRGVIHQISLELLENLIHLPHFDPARLL